MELEKQQPCEARLEEKKNSKTGKVDFETFGKEETIKVKNVRTRRVRPGLVVIEDMLVVLLCCMMKIVEFSMGKPVEQEGPCRRPRRRVLRKRRGKTLSIKYKGFCLLQYM